MSAITVTLTSSEGDALTIPTQNASTIYVQVANSSAAALTAFKIQARATSSAPFYTLYSTSSDYTTPKGILIGVGDSAGSSMDFTGMGTSTAGWFILDTRGLDSVKIRAAGDGSTLSFYVGS